MHIMSKLYPTILCSFDPPENNWRCCPCRVQLGYCTTASSSKEGQNLTIHLLCVNLKVDKLELLWLGGQFFHKCPFRIDVVFLWHSIFINDGLDLIEPRRNRKRVKTRSTIDTWSIIPFTLLLLVTSRPHGVFGIDHSLKTQSPL